MYGAPVIFSAWLKNGLQRYLYCTDSEFRHWERRALLSAKRRAAEGLTEAGA